MNCPYCKHPDSRVVDSRDVEGQEAIRRRRECAECGRRYTTYEKLEEVPITVLKRDGRSEPFREEKVLQGLLRACTKREIALSRLEELAGEVESRLRQEMMFEVTSEDIGELVLELLQDVDLVAYVRFASVYRQFESIAEFKEELEQLTKVGVR